MNYTVTLGGAIDFAPANETIEILQNVRTILSTRVGTVPLDRLFGLSWEHIDKPFLVAKALVTVEIIDAINKHEPRAVVQSVEFDESEQNPMSGLLTPKVVVSIAGDDEEVEE